MSKRKWIIPALLLTAVFAAGGWWWAQSMAPHKHELVKVETPEGKVYWTCPMHPQVTKDEAGNCPICGMQLVKREEGGQSEGELKPLYWYDPMKPDVHFDAPGKSPFMDMQLVPKFAGEGDGGQVQIDPGVVQNLGIRTAPVTRGTFQQRVDTVGAVEVDERRIIAVESRATGWVERLDVRAVGDPVRRGQRVAGVYSPDLYAAQAELVLAADTGDGELVAAARQRLSLLGLPDYQIENVLKTRRAERQAAIVAPQGGVVTELNVREGAQVMPGTPLMRIADLSRVWITLEIAETQGTWVREGRGAQARLPSLPGKVFTGKVEYVYPRLETATRTVRARASFGNPDLALKPGMYADVTVSGGAKREVLLVPSEALIRTGERTVVILSEGEGKFRPAMVMAGAEQGGQTEIVSGLQEGETVVVSGQFLIDSEANLQGALARMAPSPPTPLPQGERGEGARQP